MNARLFYLLLYLIALRTLLLSSLNIVLIHFAIDDNLLNQLSILRLMTIY